MTHRLLAILILLALAGAVIAFRMKDASTDHAERVNVDQKLEFHYLAEMISDAVVGAAVAQIVEQAG